ncbi:DUF7266 family protein [Halorubrum sp. SY-15]|uniref:DUF7266 family protein n=1 Tax=Halorubrum sp. SY-15 TaxID=3402277 RepID=UPI003EBBF805
MSPVCESAVSGDRAASTVVDYVAALAVSALLLAALTISLGGVTTTYTDRVVTDQLTVIGETTAAALERTDRLARIAEADRVGTGLHPRSVSLGVETTIGLPRSVGGSAYTVTVTADAVVVQSRRPAVTVSVAHRSRTSVAERSVRGGRVVVAYRPDTLDPAAGRLVVVER